MGKPKRERSLDETEARAIASGLRISPQKLNLVAAMIRGKKVNAALADLEFSRKRIAQDVKKCVRSAIANAENNHGLDPDDLIVSQAYVGKKLVMKRFHARGRGKSSSISKPFSILTIIVKAKPDVAEAQEA
jgi:large subunit ribosomal protein L22